jgi:acyl-CoA thioester hydrolase
MGVVYHGNYAQYFEIARTEWLRTLGVTYKDMENEGIMLPVISLSFKFIHSAKYDDLITINITIKKPPMVKIEFDYEILNEDDKLLTTGNSILAFMDVNTGRPMKCPNYILEKLTF